MINSRPAPSAAAPTPTPAPAGTTCTARLYDEYCAVPSHVTRTRMWRIHPCASPYLVLRQVRRATESTYSRYSTGCHTPTAPAVLDEASSAMPLQVKALQLESYAHVPALYLPDFTAPIFISTSTSPSPSPLASPLLSSPSHLLPSSFSAPHLVPIVLGSSGPAHSLAAGHPGPASQPFLFPIPADVSNRHLSYSRTCSADTKTQL